MDLELIISDGTTIPRSCQTLSVAWVIPVT